MFLTSKENSDRDTHDRITAILHKHPLTFTPSDINYIIVRKDSEVKAGYSAEDWVRFLEKICGSTRAIEDIKKRDKEYLEAMEKFVDSEYKRFLDA